MMDYKLISADSHVSEPPSGWSAWPPRAGVRRSAAMKRCAPIRRVLGLVRSARRRGSS